jgi:Ca-activated chloride channel family protein
MWQYISENEPSFQFENKWFLYGLIIFIPLLIGAYLYVKIWRNKTIKKYADSHLLPHLTAGYSNAKALTKYLLLRFGLSALIVAGANPQYGDKEREVVSKGIDIMIAVDVSNSMLAEDLVKDKSRLYVAKKGISQLLDQLHGDHIGIVVFAGDAFKQLPITPDYNVAKMFLKNINTDMITAQGTDIGNAIEECMSSFDLDKPTNKVIVVFSDGEDHEERALELATLAKEEGVIIHTIGMGTTSGVPIPMYDSKGYRTGYKSDQSGNTVLTKLNENVLIEVADAGGGSYTRAQGYSIGLDGLVAAINEVEKSDLNKDKFLTYEDHFQIFLLIGILCLLVDLFITERSTFGFGKIKIA